MNIALKIGLVAAAYMLYLAGYAVLQDRAFGPSSYFWEEALVVTATLVAAISAARRVREPYRGFLLLLLPAYACLLVASVTYNPQPSFLLGSGDGAVELWAVAYSLALFFWICAWGYLVMRLWTRRPHSALTGVIFAVLMLALVNIYRSFYLPDLAIGEDGALNLATAQGRLEMVYAALELVAVVAGLAGVLMGVPAALVGLLAGISVLAASDVVYAADAIGLSLALEPVWMLGLCILLAATLAIRNPDQTAVPRPARSGLSGLLLLISVGSVLVSITASELLEGVVALLSFVLILFVVGLVVGMVWLTGRFDHAVTYLRSYAKQLLQPPLEGAEWRDERHGLRGILEWTGLGTTLDSLRRAAVNLRGDVLFLGPERLNRPAEPPRSDGRVRCFVVMPYNLDWSDAVHRCLRRACQEAGVTPLRGDDLYTPTDILDDIWQGIYGADFVIADITGRNPNVLYELGIAHTLAKPVLILSRNAADIPIDLATRRILLYDCEGDGWEARLEGEVAKSVREICREYTKSPQ